MNNAPRGHDNWWIYGKDANGTQRKLHCLYYTRREAIKRFRETYDCVGKHNVIEAVIPQFGWY